MIRRGERWLLVTILLGYLPFVYFFMMYGVVDRDTMLNPSYMLWALFIAYGLMWFTDGLKGNVDRALVVLTLPVILLVYNYRIVDASNVDFVRERAEIVAENLPENALVFGNWLDVSSLEYLHYAEGVRPDITIYNLFYFPNAEFFDYMDDLAGQDEIPVVFMRPFMDNEAKTEHMRIYHAFDPEMLRPASPGKEEIAVFHLTPYDERGHYKLYQRAKPYLEQYQPRLEALATELLERLQDAN